jgi:hypothetical protein
MSDLPDGKQPSQSRRRFGAPKNWRSTFLATLADTSNISAAAAAADISLSWVYKTRREDADFRRRWFDALCEGYDNLEMELLLRLRMGESKDAEAPKFDNAIAFRLLTQHRDNVAKTKAQRDDESEEQIIASINAKLDAMRSRERAVALMLTDGTNAHGSDAQG